MSSNTSKEGMADKTHTEPDTTTNVAECQETAIDNTNLPKDDATKEQEAAIVEVSNDAIDRAIRDIGAIQQTGATSTIQETAAVAGSSSAAITDVTQENAAVVDASNIVAGNEAPPQDPSAIADVLTETPAKKVNKPPKPPEEIKHWHERRKDLSRANSDKKKKGIITPAMQTAFADLAALRAQEPLGKVVDFAREHLGKFEGVEDVVEKLETLEAEWRVVNEGKFAELVELLERSGVIPLGGGDL